MIRATTNGVLKGYKSNLMHSFITLNKARDTVLSQRNFTSFAEDPAAAIQAFQIRRSFLRTSSQYTVSQSIRREQDAAWSALDSVDKLLDTDSDISTLKDIIMADSDTIGSGRAPLGEKLKQFSASIVQSLNAKYGDTFIFAGADGLNVPFEWKEVEINGNMEQRLFYRGLDVSDPANYDKLKELSGEGRFVDIGLGLQEDVDGNLIPSSAFNAALSGLNFLGYGVDDEDGDPQNIACIIRKMGDILSRCDADSGNFANGQDREDFYRLGRKFEVASATFKEKYVEMDARANFLKNNEAQLELTADTLNEQLLGIEKCDLADAITSFSWAQYCYNAALKMGNSILSESLMDYMR